jgi:mono/diheme cytochrome c family protein
MRLSSVLLPAAVALAAAAAAAPGSGGKSPAAEPVLITQVVVQEVDGKKLYEKECGSCHGNQGRGNGRAGRDLDPRPTDITDPEYLNASDDAHLFEKIAEGTGDMDGIAVDYDEGSMNAIVAYVRELGERRK